MVRFKNRYLLIQLIPFAVVVEEEKRSGSLKRRYIDSESIDEDRESVDMDTESTGMDRESTDMDITSTITSTTITHPTSTTNQQKKLSFDPASVIGMLKHELEVNFGLQGSASLALSLTAKYTNTATGMLILRCPRDLMERVLSTVAWCSSFPQAGMEGLKCTWRVIHCAGTIKATQRAAISFARKEGKLTPELSKKLQQLDG